MKLFSRTLPQLLSCLALAVACTPAPARVDAYSETTISGDNLTVIVHTKNITINNDRPGDPVYTTRMILVSPLYTEPLTILASVTGCVRRSGIVFVTPDMARPVRDAEIKQVPWVYGGTDTLSIAAAAVCKIGKGAK